MNLLSTKYKLLGMLQLLTVIHMFSCKKLINVEAPVNRTTQDNVYNSDDNAIAVLTGIYTKLSEAELNTTQFTSIAFWTGLSSDELIPFDMAEPRLDFYKNSLTVNSVGNDIWSNIYPIIFVANSALEGLSASKDLTLEVKLQLEGEAKFIRALCYFYLVNLYGDVPLSTSTNWKINTVLSRTSKQEVWQQIVLDLKDAQSLLSINYMDKFVRATTDERVRPTKWAATSLLARVYLYLKDWQNAEEEATAVLNQTALYDTVSINDVFLRNNKEAIWQLQPVITGRNTQDGWLFTIPSSGPDGGHPVYLNDILINSFEYNDLRRVKWVDSVKAAGVTYYYPAKYKSATLNDPLTEYSVVIRLAEQYLIRAEARAHQNKIAEGKTDLDVIRNRAGLPPNTAIDKASLLEAILKERRFELFTEWGHRWFDIKRTETIDVVMNSVTPQKGGTWISYQQFYPISQSELSINPNLTQNTGY